MKDLPLSSEDVERYLGKYDLAGEPLEVYPDLGRLMMRIGGADGLRLLYQGSNEFAVESDPSTKLYFRISHGRATSLTFTAGELTLNAQRKEPGS